MTRNGWKTGVTAGAALVLVLGLLASSAVAETKPGASPRLPRAYEGAPPLVPHDVEARKGLCNECHTTGVDGAPITPHPTRTHFCVACHVGQDRAVKPFVPSTWRR